jgi:hypothetical protein
VQVQTTEVSIGKDNQYPKQRVSGAITRLLTSLAARIHVYNSQAKRENDGAIPGYTGIIVAKKKTHFEHALMFLIQKSRDSVSLKSQLSSVRKVISGSSD